MRDIQIHKGQLSETRELIQSLPLFCIAVKTFVKDFYFFNTDVDILHKVESIIIILLFSVFRSEGSQELALSLTVVVSRPVCEILV